MIQSNFRDWTLDKIDDTFGTTFVNSLPILDKWLAYEYEINEVESDFLKKIRDSYFYLGGENWNEVELESKVISPLIVYADVPDIEQRRFNYFMERDLGATIGAHILSGRVDGMIASGFRSPKQPYFCISEFKKAKDPKGEPEGQALIAMLVGKALNQDKHPILGCYIVGRQWVFMALEGMDYTFSKSFAVDDEDIFEIYRLLKGLKWQIEEWAK